MTPTTTPTHESRLDSILQHIGAILQILLPVAQAVASPFLKNANTKAIVAQEVPIVEGIAEGLAGKQE